MKKYIALLLALSLLLAGCAGKENNEPATENTTKATESTTLPTDPATQPTEPSSEPEETDPTEPEVLNYYNPLTGEPMAEPATARPFAVVLNNSKQALPHWNVSKAQMIWELPHEYGTSRLIAMYSDVSNLTWLGSMRSARTFHISLAMSFDAIFVHAGHSNYAKDKLKYTGWDAINGVEGKYASKYFHRDQNRLDAGFSLEHTMYTTGPEVIAYSTDMGYDLTRDEELDYGMKFADDGTPVDGQSASEIMVQIKSGGKKSYLKYDENAGCYTWTQYDMVYTDGISGDVPQFENVLVLKADVNVIEGSEYRLQAKLVGSGTGYFACGGRMIPIRWSRSSEKQPFVYTLEDGSRLTFGVGNTYAAVIYSDSGKVIAE